MERVELELDKGDEVKWEHDDGLRRGVVLVTTPKAVLIFVSSGDDQPPALGDQSFFVWRFDAASR